MRFVPAVAALAPGWTRFTGDAAAARRPIEPLLRALEQLGIAVQRTPGATLPFAVLGRRHLPGGSVTLDASASSQFLSALLLAAPRFTQGLAVRLEPARLPSRPHVAMTLAALRAFGASASEPSPDNNTWRVASGGLTGRDIGIEPDLTNAAPFLAAAVATGGTVRIEGWPATTTQAGALMLDYLMAFGATPTLTGGTLAVTGTGPIQGVDLDLADAGELAPTVAALAALATSASHLGGIGHLRGHETDRLAALACEINRLGGRAQVVADGLTIRPAPLHGAHLATYGDHRMAMFGAVAGLRVKGVVLEDIGVTTKTFPGFAAAWAGLV
jgi:3-phosphoshikimate 1-carboxyvinyltransferase